MSFLFDYEDRVLLEEVNSVLEGKASHITQMLNPLLHPRGIKELSAPRGIRIACAVASVLKSLSSQKSELRLSALRSLRDEVLSSGSNEMRYNAARVITQIIKDLVRSVGNARRQLELVSDFRSALSGKPRFIRSMLKRYHLLEMPEEYRAVTFDGHVHDASTKGRKSPSHLILDAWIKGVNSLLVIYYNYIRPEVAHELITAAGILGLKVKIGIEFPVRFYGRIINLIWSPQGFDGPKEFLRFLGSARVAALMERGRKLSEYQQRQVIGFIDILNVEAVADLEKRFGITMPRLDALEFREFVGQGHASFVHLSEYLHFKLGAVLHQKEQALKRHGQLTPSNESARIMLKDWHELDTDKILRDYLKPLADKFNLYSHVPEGTETLPELLNVELEELILRVEECSRNNQLTLSTANLDSWDVPEIIHRCSGTINSLEIFNLKDYIQFEDYDTSLINSFRLALNAGDITALKRVCSQMLEKLQSANVSYSHQRIEGLKQARRNLGRILELYGGRKVAAAVGSDSTGRSRNFYGMGLAVVDTLGSQAQSFVRSGVEKSRTVLPVTAHCQRSVVYPNPPVRGWRRIFSWFSPKLTKWTLMDRAVRINGKGGNLVTLGGREVDPNDDVAPVPTRGIFYYWHYLNRRYKNCLKIIAGFIPAFLTFYFSKDWAVLTYGGAFIWFGITGLRNVIQAVLGGSGFSRSKFLRWRNFIDMSRISDSLMYTGFSVPLLDYVVKNLLLAQTMEITVKSNSMAVFAVMALINGLYISGHNILRGLPKAAIYGNLVRAVFAVPLAMGYNFILKEAFIMGGMENVEQVLELWAAVVSKTASDSVACIIEGLADRAYNLRQRLNDYGDTIRNYFQEIEKIEMVFPEQEAAELFAEPKKLLRELKRSGNYSVVHGVFAGALDMMYFRYCQPRAQLAFKRLLEQMSDDQRKQLLLGQEVLKREKTVTRLLAEGFAGKTFRGPLSFYLDNHPAYLRELDKLA